MAAIALAGNMIDPGGSPASGCKLTSCIRGTSTPSPLYSDVGLATPTTNPYVGDADGRLEFYYSSLIQYTWTVRTSDDATILWQADVVGGVVMVTYINGILIDGSWGFPLATTYRGVEYVENYAALTALTDETGLSDGAVYCTLGRTVAGDGGDGLWRYDAASSASANGGTILAIDGGGAGRFMHMVVADSYSAAWFGATGATLATSVATGATNNYPVFGNPGTYAFGAAETVAITASTHFYGAGPATILRAAADRSVPVVYVNGASGDNVTLEKFRVETTYSGSPTASQYNAGVVAEGVDDITIRDIEVEGKFYVGVMVKDCAKVTIENVRIRGAKNRQLYVFENCSDVTIDGVKLDCRDASDTDYGDYGLNINPGGTDQPRRIVVTGVTVQGYVAHGVSISEDYEEAIITGVTGVTSTAAAVGLLLQDANAKRGRKYVVSDISMKGGDIPIYIKGSDNLSVANILADAGVGTNANILVIDCKDLQGANWQAKDGAGAGVKFYGTASDDSTNINVVGITAEGNAGDNIFCDAGASNALRRVTLSGINSHNAGTYGLRATSNCDSVFANGGQISSSGTADYLNSSTLGKRRSLMLSGVLESPTSVVYTSSNTWTKANYPGLVAIEVEVVGGGGGGGGAAGNSVNSAAAGGGGGGRSIKRILVASLGTTETVTVGAGGAGGANTGGDGATGGTSSFGSHATATGGVGGFGVNSATFVRGGEGGLGASGDANLKGQAGGGGAGCTGLGALSGAGGGEGGAYGRAISSGGAGAAGVAGVNGGGGGGAAEGSTTNRAGGAGGDGYIRVTLHY